MIKCNSKNDWSTLYDVALGAFMKPNEVKRIFDASYLSEFTEVIQKIADETHDDLMRIQEELEKHGVTVHRPDMDTITEMQAEASEEIKLTLNKDETGYAADVFFNDMVIPISPRNDIMVYQDVVYSNGDFPAGFRLSQFDNKCVNSRDHGYDILDWPCITRVNDRLIIGNGFDRKAIELLQENHPDSKIVVTDMRGHVDATLACIKNGVLLTTERHPVEVYEETFPGWIKYQVGKNGYHHMIHQQNNGVVHGDHDLIDRIKQVSDNKWWIKDFEKLPNSGKVGDLINTFFSNWFGYSEETYFEINCLTIDPNTTMAIGDDKTLNTILNKVHNHQVINMQFRHRWFFDQGLHCLTTDLKRGR